MVKTRARTISQAHIFKRHFYTKGNNMAKKTSSKNDVQAQAIVGTIDLLVKQREDFEQNEFARSNKRLYEILSEVMKAFEKASETKALLVETVKQMKATLEAKQIRIQTNTPALTLFVRYVFRSDRQRSMNYSNTLQAAIQKGIKAEGLASFIEECGGVESCKKEFTKSKETLEKEQAIQTAMPLVKESLEESKLKPLATFKVPSEMVAETYNKGFVFVIAKANRQGNIQALSVVPAHSKGMASWAEKELARFIVKQKQASNKKVNSERKEERLLNVKGSIKRKTPTKLTVGELLAA